MTDFVQDTKTGKWSIPKDPDAILDYIENWVDWLTPLSDTISSASVTVTAGAVGSNVAVDSSVVANGTHVHAWISGGVAGEKVTVRYRVNTAGLRRDDRSFTLNIKDR